MSQRMSQAVLVCVCVCCVWQGAHARAAGSFGVRTSTVVPAQPPAMSASVKGTLTSTSSLLLSPFAMARKPGHAHTTQPVFAENESLRLNLLTFLSVFFVRTFDGRYEYLLCTTPKFVRAHYLLPPAHTRRVYVASPESNHCQAHRGLDGVASGGPQSAAVGGSEAR